ncbi:6-phosphofructokinase [Micromonospora sp. LOL_027]|uniref:6-phosphofructokinase n=1 Tax=Micromonospora sp. LOL_027 TaxID=3345419 RepID=UPI003A88ED42
MEATAFPGGIGLVQLMGRHSGFIACYAALATHDADFVLVPEAPFALDGPGGFLAHLRRRVAERGHTTVVAAEGAGQEHLAGEPAGHDASGNLRLHDFGRYLRRRIVENLAAAGHESSVKYIDPSCTIRGVPGRPARRPVAVGPGGHRLAAVDRLIERLGVHAGAGRVPATRHCFVTTAITLCAYCRRF